MKHIYKLFILMLITVLFITLSTIKVTSKEYKINNTQYNSYNLVEYKEDIDVVKEDKKDEIKEVVKEEPKKDVALKEEAKEQPQTQLPKEEVENKETVLESLIGNISGYGYDCYGCTSGRTSTGYDITNGNIYYNDQDYGEVKIVAADKKYSFGTIVKISSFMGEQPFYAIVLDRGSSIGLDKNIQFDLVYPHNNDALSVGIQKNVTFDIVRLGF